MKLSIQIIKNIAKKVEVNKAVVFGILAKVWGMFAGSITTIIIATKFTPELQGYYYTFASLLALQGFADLGIGTAIIQFASHEWSHLSFDKHGQIVGKSDALSRLISLGQISLRWFSIASLLGVIGLSIGGVIFFSTSQDTAISWKMPWILLSFLTGINIYLIPIWSLLEGCNQVNNVYLYRLMQGFFSSTIIWIAILLGAKLWTVVISTFVVIIWAIFFIYKFYRQFFKKVFWSTPGAARINWLKEMLPLQWRFAVSGICAYFSFSFFTPVLFRYHGAVVAGQMGMTWVLVSIIGMFSTSWLLPKVPQFGMFIAQKKFHELDDLFWRLIKIIFTISFLAVLFAWGGVYFLNKINYPFAKRLLPPLPSGLFLIAQFFLVISMPFASYLRAHKKEPLIYASICFTLLVILSNLTLGKYYSALGIAIGYLVLNIIFIPVNLLIWKICRARWHAGALANSVNQVPELNFNQEIIKQTV